MIWKHRLRAAAQKLFGLNLMDLRLQEMQSAIDLLRKDLEITRRDLLAADALSRSTSIVMKSCAGPAIDSVDHIVPKGTVRDNTRWPRLVQWAESQFGRKVRFLDLGCAGGGLVFDFVASGHDATGVEGSDWSARFARAEWGTIPARLFVADITREFRLWDTAHDAPAQFDLITAWEVLEHIPEEKLRGLFLNVSRHLSPGGIFAASVATYEDVDSRTGMRWHQTVKPRTWWLESVKEVAPDLEEMPDGWSTKDFPRGSGNPYLAWDWDADTQPDRGFHLVLRKI